MRKHDTMWRDGQLAAWHTNHDFDAPAPGMTLPMIEYDHGQAVGTICYHRRGTEPVISADAVAARAAFANLHAARDGYQLPFLMAVYDPRNWAMSLYPCNESALKLGLNHGRWTAVTEADFVTLLYRMRGLKLPNLKPYGVVWNTEAWSEERLSDNTRPEAWPGADLSARRRAYEPMAFIPHPRPAGGGFGPVVRPLSSQLVPCMDVDFAVVDRDARVALLVDYKHGPWNGELASTNMQALASMETGDRRVPAMVVRYRPSDDTVWSFEAYCLNTTASDLLSRVLGGIGAGRGTMAQAMAGDGWVPLTEDQWLSVLHCARDL